MTYEEAVSGKAPLYRKWRRQKASVRTQVSLTWSMIYILNVYIIVYSNVG